MIALAGCGSSSHSSSSTGSPTAAIPPGRGALFAVSGIPGAQGFGATGPRNSGLNVAFSVGRYYYLVGEGSQGAPLNKAALIAAAKHLYHRVSA